MICFVGNLHKMLLDTNFDYPLKLGGNALLIMVFSRDCGMGLFKKGIKKFLSSLIKVESQQRFNDTFIAESTGR